MFGKQKGIGWDKQKELLELCVATVEAATKPSECEEAVFTLMIKIEGFKHVIDKYPEYSKAIKMTHKISDGKAFTHTTGPNKKDLQNRLSWVQTRVDECKKKYHAEGWDTTIFTL